MPFVIMLEGVGVGYADDFGLTRANTAAVIVLRFEVDSAAGLARIQQNFHRVLLDVAPD